MRDPGDSLEWDLFKPVLSTDIKKLQKSQAAPLPEPDSSKNPPVRKSNSARRRQEAVAAPRVPESEAEIEAWIAERKKRFPTQSRIAGKERDMKEREDRGALDLTEVVEKKGRGNVPIEMSSKFPRKVPSLIDKLMADEERRERSIILQCFRYFRSHGFLQDPPPADVF
jgi:hypothetical protein